MLKLSGVTTLGKVDTLKFNPTELVPNFAAFTGRKARTEAQIEAMAASLLLNGQIENFLYRKGFKSEPIPVTGHTRILAAARITREGRTGANGVKYSLENPFVVRGDFRQLNEVEAMFVTFAENDEDTRTKLNDVDIALFIRTVSDTTKLTDSEIATKLGKLPAWVSTHRTILDLDPDSQDAIASGEVKMGAVANLAAIEPAKRAAARAKAKENGGKVTAPALAKAAAELGAETNKVLKRTDAEAKAWLNGAIERTPAGPVNAFLFGMKDFRNGVITAAELDALLDVLSGESTVSVGA